MLSMFIGGCENLTGLTTVSNPALDSYMLGRKQERAMLYTIELIRFIPGRVGVLSQITHADKDPEAAKEKAKRFLMETKVANATRVRLLNADGVEVFNWGPDR